jgi:hypothetical protein
MLRGLLSCAKWRPIVGHAVKHPTARRGIAASPAACARKMPDRPPLVHEDEFTECFLKGSGPGGQKIVCCSQLNPERDKCSKSMHQLTSEL